MEAYAAGKPVVAARATGTVDAVVDGETGLLFPIGDVPALVSCLHTLLCDKVAATKFGAAGQHLINREFRQPAVWNALKEEYCRLLQIESQSRSKSLVSKERQIWWDKPMNRDRQGVLKRILDFVSATVGLILLCPLLLLVALAIRISMSSPALFRQTRAGHGGKAFRILKFRTMIDAYDPEGRPLSDKVRITWLGRLLRKTSIDELPQLLNVLSGEMSLVGPRPLRIEYVKLYAPWQARRLEVRPGITGLAQIKGRNKLSWEERFALDVWYVDHQSLLLDLRILLWTAVNLLRRNSVGGDGDLDVPSFTGTLSADRPEIDLRTISSSLP